jgi:hypothetical protein
VRVRIDEGRAVEGVDELAVDEELLPDRQA